MGLAEVVPPGVNHDGDSRSSSLRRTGRWGLAELVPPKCGLAELVPPELVPPGTRNRDGLTGSAGSRMWAGRFLDKLLEIIYEDSELLVANKPAGLVCHPTKGDAYSSLVSRARLYLGSGSHPQLVNRLDRETSGVTLIAKTEQSARELRRLWEQRRVQKEYVAIVHGAVSEPHGVIEAPLGKDSSSRVAIKDWVRADGSPALTEYWVEQPAVTGAGEGTHGGSQLAFTQLRVVPHTGRKHQIRIHLAHLGHAVVGDKLYGGDEDLYMALVEDRLTAEQRARLILPYHALHAREVRLSWRGLDRCFRAEPEAWFTEFLEKAVSPGPSMV